MSYVSFKRVLTEEERLTITESLKTHIAAAMDARDHYRACITRAKLAEADSIEQEGDNTELVHNENSLRSDDRRS